MKINSQELKQIISESIMRIMLEDEGERLDKYGNKIPRFGQGWGADSSLRNRQGYNKDGTPGPWFSRSVAVATAVMLNDNGSWYILANERGSGTPDYQGYWNLPCGYLDYNESAEQAAAREVYEETGIRCNNIEYFGHSTSPNENRQNVVYFFVSFLEGSIDDYNFSKENMEENEVGGIKWVPVNETGNVKWAFDHDELVERIKAKYANRINNESPSGNNPVQLLDTLRNGIERNIDQEYLLKLVDRIKSLI